MIFYTGFVYIWYDKKRKWFCIGSHMGQLNDGYITSTGFMKEAYNKRPEDFSRRILEYYYGNNRKELHELEQKWLDKIHDRELCMNENISNGTTKYYNMKKHASGLSGYVASNNMKSYWRSEEGLKRRKIMSEQGTFFDNTGSEAWNKGKKCPEISTGRKKNPIHYTDEMRENSSIRFKMLWQDPNFRKKMENRNKADPQKLSEARLGYTHKDETKNKISQSLKNREKSKEAKKNMSVSAIERSERIVTCPHCNKSGNGPVMNRWHFSNCKYQ